MRKKRIGTRRASMGERRFAFFWKALGGPPIESEYTFAPPKTWRFDFALPEKKIAIEIEGGVWTGGRHVRGAGFTKDCQKYQEAVFLGWTLFRLTTAQVTAPMVERLIRKSNG